MTDPTTHSSSKPFVYIFCTLCIAAVALIISIIVISIRKAELEAIATEEKAVMIAELSSGCRSQYPDSGTPLADCVELGDAMSVYEEGGIKAVDAYYQDFVDASDNDSDIATTRAKQVIALAERFNADVQEVERNASLVNIELVPSDVLEDYYNALYVFYLINGDEETAKRYYSPYITLAGDVVDEEQMHD